MYRNLKIGYDISSEKKAISLTTYRAYFIANLLNISPKSYDEILQSFANDKFLKDFRHKDTISNSINSLRKAGFDIEKPKPSNGFRFVLLSVPFKLKVSDEFLMLLYLLNSSIYCFNDYKTIFGLNSLFELFEKLTLGEDINKLYEDVNILKNIDIDVLRKLIQLCEEKATARINYVSPVHGEEELKIKPQKIVFENNRLYVWLYCYKYDSPAYFRIDKIKSIINVEKDDLEINTKLSYTVIYELIGESAKKFLPLKNEVIVEKQIDKILVRAEIINPFNFFQRIICFSDECKIIEPMSIVNLYMKRIDKILGVYENEL